MADGDRSSKLKVAEEFKLPSPEELAETESKNTIAQYDLMVSLVEEALAGRFRLRLSTLGKLNEVAVQGTVASPGALRSDDNEIVGSSHETPPWQSVTGHLEDLCDYVNDGLGGLRTPLHLSAYVMWRLNWIHPYADGNGRTSRAASYLVLCIGLKHLLPGDITIPEQIAAEKRKYYRALEAADRAWKDGRVDVSEMESLIGEYLGKQLQAVISKANGQPVDPPIQPRMAWDSDD